MGIREGIAADAPDYVDVAVRIGTDRAFAEALRGRILTNNAVLFEDRRVVLEFERFFSEAMDSAAVNRSEPAHRPAVQT